MKEIKRNKETIEQAWEKATKSISLAFDDIPIITDYSSIPNYWKGQIKDYNYSDWLRV